MNRITLEFTANGQVLCPVSEPKFASNTVNYIDAHFSLDEEWEELDSVRAVWYTDSECISTVLDQDGNCYVPHEVLKRKDELMVNLVGSVVEDDVLTDRLTSYPAKALDIDATAQICGTETTEVTPSQFEQFVSIVIAEVEKVTGMTAVAVPLPEGADPTASYEDGVLTLGIPKGEKGDTGNGIERVEFNSDYSLTFYFTESEPYTTPSIRGERGAQGYGIVDVEKIGSVGLVDTYQVNYENPEVEPTTFEITNGAKGDTGNGIASIAKIGTVGLVDTYRINFTNGGHHDFTVTNGEKGDTGETGNGIDRIELTDTTGAVKTYTIYFTDGSTYDFEVTDGEVTLAELASVLPTDTASGAIASFEDGSDLFDYLSCIVDIDPVQDLHGYDKPWAGGSGKNKLDNSFMSDAGTGVQYHTLTLKPNTEYTMSTTDTGVSGAANLFFCNMDESASSGTNGVFSGIPKTRTTDNNGQLRVGYRCSNGQITPAELMAYKTQVEEGSTATTFEPYANLCPITGWTGCEVDVAGVNQWDEVWELGDLNTNTGADYPATDRIRSKNYVPIFPNTVYYNACGKNIGVCFYDANKSFIAPNIIANANTTFTTPANSRYLRFYVSPSYGTTYKNDISINYPSTDHDYHAHNPNSATYPVSWQTEAGTVYGGKLHIAIVDGELKTWVTVTHAKKVLNGTETWIAGGNPNVSFYMSLNDMAKLDSYGNDIKCDKLQVANTYVPVYTTEYSISGYKDNGSYPNQNWIYAKASAQFTTASEFKAWLSNNNVEITYPLATPTTYQLDPVQVACLLGTNNVWADCGDIEEVKYKADVQLWVLKKLGE